MFILNTSSIFSLIFLCLTITISTSTDVTINCDFKNAGGWHVLDEIYACEVSDITDITQPDAIITAITGDHQDGKTNLDVLGFRVKNKKVLYFPKYLNKFFPNLIAISILSSNLKDIKQSDISPFPQLRYLNLFQNQLTRVGDNLFEINLELEVIGLHYNKIESVNPKVIQRLKKLKFFWLEELEIDRF